MGGDFEVGNIFAEAVTRDWASAVARTLQLIRVRLTRKQKTVKTPGKNSRRNGELEGFLREIFIDCPDMSDRAIAKHVGVSNRTVSQHRKRLANAGEILPHMKSTQSMQTWLHEVCTWVLREAPENDKLYDPVRENETAFLGLVEDIRMNGLQNPIGVSRDGYIFDGHRRLAAVKYLGWEKVQVRIRPDISYRGDPHKFMDLLRSCNNQRVKTTAEAIREGVAGMGDNAWQRVCDYREDASEIDGVETIELYGVKRRSEIRDKTSLKNAIVQVVEENENEWPLSDRKIFYLLLNIKGLLRNDRQQTPFGNSEECYKDVTNMLTRLRIDDSIPFDAIGDETRPVLQWNTHKSVGTFISTELENLFSGYWRDLLQGQPNWIELLVEKNTVASSLKSIAGNYTIPMTSGRGYSSLPPRKGMIDRFKASGREKLVIIVVSDFDPEGEDIPNSFGLSLRDDFYFPEERLVIIKAALTHEQVRTLALHEGQLVKEGSSRYQRFVDKYGEHCWEVEAVEFNLLREIVESTIRKILDIDAFEVELAQQSEDQKNLNEYRQKIKERIAD